MILTCAGITYAADKQTYVKLGKQADGSYLVSTEQRIEPNAIAFDGRPVDMALHPSGDFVAVLNQHSVLLVSPDGVVPYSHIWLRSRAGFRAPLSTAGFRGIAWSPDGSRLFVSTASGYVQELKYQDKQLKIGTRIEVKPFGIKENPRPGGMAVTRDGERLFVAALDRNAVAEIDLTNSRWVREFPVQNLPFEVKLSEDEKTLIVTNWGGREATDQDERAASGDAVIVVDPRGAAASGTVSLIRRSTGETSRLRVGLHPTAITVKGDRAYITNAASDSVTEINLSSRKVLRTMALRWGAMNLFGSMPCALAVENQTAYVCNGGDNAVCVLDLRSGSVRGFRPAGFYPLAIALDPTGNRAYVLNTKGNGSVRSTNKGFAGSVHDFQGTVSIIDLSADLKSATDRVAANNGWNRGRSSLNPNLAVYHGAIQHVLYIIKENRPYDEVLGDIPQGNGDPKLCLFGATITPNHHALARQFTLFDNAYVSGTNSADGHQWCTQALANDYLEHFYTGYRTYSFDGTCAMSISSTGCLWDAALKKNLYIRDYGEFCDAKLAVFTPSVKTWLDVWNDRVSGRHHIEPRSGSRVPALRPYINRRVLCWPLLQSDQERADIFIGEYRKFSRAGRVPNLMFLTLPCDHTEGTNPGYPRPDSMVADNDLALGRVVEAVSKSSQWKNTCIFVIEDDAQFGRDHVDGHRTVYYAISPYTRRRHVSHELCNTVSMVRSIELMLGMDPMNRFDALTPPLRDCFTDKPNLSSYTVISNRIALDQMNPSPSTLQGKALYWTKQSMALDWNEPDLADPRILNQVVWHALRGDDTPYPLQ